MDLVTYGTPTATGGYSSQAYANSVRSDLTYNSVGSVRTLKVSSNHAGNLSDFTYSVTDDGMLASIHDNLQADGQDQTQNFSYDSAHRLTGATGPYGSGQTPQQNRSYTYGSDGQILSFGSDAGQYGGNAHRLTQMGQTQYVYDTGTGGPGRGNVILIRRNGVTRNLVYNYQNRVSSVDTYGSDGNSRTTFRYDAEGNRFMKRFDRNDDDTLTYYLSPDYRIRQNGGDEMHTLYLMSGDTVLADFSFIYQYHLSDSILGMNSGRDRLLANLNDLRYLSPSQFYRLPTIFSAMVVNARAAIQPDGKLIRAFLYSLAGTAGLVGVLWLVILWWKNPEKEKKLLPVSILRTASLVSLVAFYSSCVGVLNSQKDSDAGYLMADGILLANGAGGSSSSSAFNGDNLGSHFYVTDTIGSVRMVTDSNGKVLAKNVYEPYGQRNAGLSSIDADGNGSLLESSRLYTGQEYDSDIDLYNYNARLYDPETGRFLQPDEEHTEIPGMDGYDAYAYVSGNPVNYRDPDGKWPQLSNDGMAMMLINAAPDPSTVALLLLYYQASGQFDSVFHVPYHNYSGDGNRDRFDFFNGFHRKEHLVQLLFLLGGLTPENFQTIATVFVVAHLLAPKAADMVDRAAVTHDHRTPGSEYGHVGSGRYDRKMMGANKTWFTDIVRAGFSTSYYSGLYERAYERSGWIRSNTLRSIWAAGSAIGRWAFNLFVVFPLGTLFFAGDNFSRWGAERMQGLKKPLKKWHL